MNSPPFDFDSYLALTANNPMANVAGSQQQQQQLQRPNMASSNPAYRHARTHTGPIHQQGLQQEHLAAAAAMGINAGTFSSEISLQIPRFLGNPVLGGSGQGTNTGNIGDFTIKDGMFVGAMDGFQGWFPDFNAFAGDPHSDSSVSHSPTSPFSANPNSNPKYYALSHSVDDQSMSPNPPNSAGGHTYTTHYRSPFDFPLSTQPLTSPTPPFEYPLDPNSAFPTSGSPSRRQSLQQGSQPLSNPYHQSQAHSALGLSLPGPPGQQLTSRPMIDIPKTKELQIMYSATGFDMLGVLARVATRPNPKIVLGPVDMTCSFLVVDVRKWDCPIVYASPTFTRLTGYSEAEILGRNCRFLQAPPDCPVEKGSERTYTAPDQVAHLWKYLSQDKECQASLINYRKSGEAFINLVTVIPIAWDTDQIAYHVGFQVDLTEQPHAILQTMRDGSYIVNYSSTVPMTPSVSNKSQNRLVSREMRSIIASIFGGSAAYGSTSEDQERLDLNMALLEHSPDVVHVLSLKGSFLFVSPSVKRVLEYEQSDLLGKSISDICHPSDVVPLMRELKDSSPTNTASSTSGGPSSPVTAAAPPPPLKTVNLLFRVRRKHSGYVWVECIGRLYSEPGKGRKAIILTARRRDMPKLAWASVEQAGGVSGANQEFWGQISREGIVLVVSANVREVVGRGAKDIVGNRLFRYIVDSNSTELKQAEVKNILEDAVSAKIGDEQARMAYCETMFEENSGPTGPRKLSVEIAFFPPSLDSSSEVGPASPMVGEPPPRRPPRASSAVFRVRLLRPDETFALRRRYSTSDSQRSSNPYLQRSSSISSRSPPQQHSRIGSSGNSLPGIGGGPSSPTSRHSSGSSLRPTGNVFEELEITRGTSWMYELQQLKISNKRMRDEVEGLEKQQANNAAGLHDGNHLGPGPNSGLPMSGSSMAHRTNSSSSQSIRYTPGGIQDPLKGKKKRTRDGELDVGM